jgi:diguanylate cyclase (GGDEF)-like protein
VLAAVLLGALYVVAYRTEFVAAGGSTVPTEPVLVGLLLVTPLPLVPLVVLVALQIGGVGVQETGSRARDLLARMISGWHCLGPVAVLWLLPVPQPALSAWPVYLLALLAQFTLDAGSAAVRSWALGVPPRRLVGPLRWTFTVDTLLAPLGLCVVVATAGHPAGLALLAAPLGLVRLLARDRSRQLEAAVTLGTAFTAVHEEARVDALTGLANRRAWAEAVDGAGARLADDDRLVAVVLIADVDGLKKVNDRHGHDVGDELIRAVAATIAGAAPADAVVARLGGDEFGILALVPDGDPVARTLLSDVRGALTDHPGVRGTELSASLGLAACPPVDDVPTALTVADLAAAEDKVLRRAGRD